MQTDGAKGLYFGCIPLKNIGNILINQMVDTEARLLHYNAMIARHRRYQGTFIGDAILHDLRLRRGILAYFWEGIL